MKLRWIILLTAALSQNLFGQPWPSVAVVAPPNGTTLDSGLVSLAVETSDVDGFVAEVKYDVDGVYFGSGFPPSFELPVLVNNGRHLVRALAYDNVGYYTLSPKSWFQVGGEFRLNLVRGPYLQSLSSTSVVVRWRTDWPTNSIVCLSPAPPGAGCVTNAGRVNEHEVRLTGLAPDTLYAYSIGSAAETFSIGTGLTFRTAPTNTRPVSVWVIGDSGTANANAQAVKDAYLDYIGTAGADLWLMLGDNAYEVGTDDEYQAAVFDMYREILSRVPVWPTLGNHDSGSTGSPGEFPYLDIFTLPPNGEAGGVPSGTEKYYSFDYANIHFICLDSQSSSRAANGPMLSWLQEDLAATEKDWIVAYWHHPPYSKGTHNSDGEGQLIEMRERALPILENYGVDLVLAGHSHVYERSYLLDGHYGFGDSLTPSMILDGTLGNTLAHPYRKAAGGMGVGGGTVYAVCGCSGEGGPSPFFFGTHPAMARSLGNFGSMVLRFDGLRLEARFLRPNGDIDDYFIVDKTRPTLVRPELKIARTIGGAELSWPTSIPVFSLEGARQAAADASWLAVPGSARLVGRRHVVDVPIDESNRFFRLRAP